MNTYSKTILVTGASGFLGSHAVPFLQKYFHVRTHSLRFGDTFQATLFSEVDTVLFLTGIAHQSKRIDPNVYYQVNKELAVDLAKEAKRSGVTQFIYISSVKAIGEESNGMIFEGIRCNPQTDYGKSKWLAEQELNTLSDPQFVVTIIRPAVVYGKGAKGNIDKLLKLINKLPVVPLGGIDNKRSMVYIGNFLALLKQTIDLRASGTFTATDNRSVSTSEIVEKINTLNAKRKKIINFPKVFEKILIRLKPDMHAKLFGDFEVDNSVTNQKLNFTPPYSFESGLREMMSKEHLQNK